MARKKQMAASNAVAVVATMMLLVSAATAQNCGVGGDTMQACLSYCSNGRNKNACCGPMRGADVGCLCRSYWGRYKYVPYVASCVAKVSSQCRINAC